MVSSEIYDHNQHTHVDPTEMREVKSMFRGLANPSLLAKCLHGKTRNPSESLNNVIWSRLPKSTFVMKSTLKLGVYDAMACYNDGNIAKCEILSKLGIAPGSKCIAAMKSEDLCRVAKVKKGINEIGKKLLERQQQQKGNWMTFMKWMSVLSSLLMELGCSKIGIMNRHFLAQTLI